MAVPRGVSKRTTPDLASVPYSSLSGPRWVSSAFTAVDETGPKSKTPPTSFAGTSSIVTLFASELPPRTNNEVSAPYWPLGTTDMPGCRRNSCAMSTRVCKA